MQTGFLSPSSVIRMDKRLSVGEGQLAVEDQVVLRRAETCGMRTSKPSRILQEKLPDKGNRK